MQILKRINYWGIRETGSAMILDESLDKKIGFGNFVFKGFTQYIDHFTSQIGQNSGISFLKHIKNPNLENCYIECIVKTVQELLDQEGVKLSQISKIFPPQISPNFVHHLGKKMNILKERFIDLTFEGKDFFTSSLSYPFQFAPQE